MVFGLEGLMNRGEKKNRTTMHPPRRFFLSSIFQRPSDKKRRRTNTSQSRMYIYTHTYFTWLYFTPSIQPPMLQM